MPNSDTVILVAHGQPSDPEPAEDNLAGLGRRVQAHLPELRVLTATLATKGKLEKACQSAGAGVMIYPCFMARGYFTAQVLPKRLEDMEATPLPPLGTEPELPALVAAYLRAEIRARDWEASETDLLLAAHGSGRGNKAAEAAYDFITRLTPLCPVAGIRAGFVEQDPRVKAQAEQSQAPALCLPFFALEGDHVRSDIRDALSEAKFPGALLPVIADLPGIERVIAQSIRIAART